MTRPLLEVSTEGVDGLLVAQDKGANRVELCASVLEGGITPSIGMVGEALRRARIPVFVIVRPRGGDFLYTEAEFESMRQDVMALKDLGVPGVVTGCLTAGGEVDEKRSAELLRVARPMSFTYHRASSAMTYRNPQIAMGLTSQDHEYIKTVTDPTTVRSMVEAARREFVI